MPKRGTHRPKKSGTSRPKRGTHRPQRRHSHNMPNKGGTHAEEEARRPKKRGTQAEEERHTGRRRAAHRPKKGAQAEEERHTGRKKAPWPKRGNAGRRTAAILYFDGMRSTA